MRAADRVNRVAKAPDPEHAPSRFRGVRAHQLAAQQRETTRTGCVGGPFATGAVADNDTSRQTYMPTSGRRPFCFCKCDWPHQNKICVNSGFAPICYCSLLRKIVGIYFKRVFFCPCIMFVPEYWNIQECLATSNNGTGTRPSSCSTATLATRPTLTIFILSLG